MSFCVYFSCFWYRGWIINYYFCLRCWSRLIVFSSFKRFSLSSISDIKLPRRNTFWAGLHRTNTTFQKNNTFHLTELNFCHKLKFVIQYFVGTWSCKPLIFLTLTIWSNRIYNLKYQMSTILVCLDIGIWQFGLVTNTQFFFMITRMNCFSFVPLLNIVFGLKHKIL